MNTLSDTLNDFAEDLIKKIGEKYFPKGLMVETDKMEVIEEYLERIINELNVNKYLK